MYKYIACAFTQNNNTLFTKGEGAVECLWQVKSLAAKSDDPSSRPKKKKPYFSKLCSEHTCTKAFVQPHTHNI